MLLISLPPLGLSLSVSLSLSLFCPSSGRLDTDVKGVSLALADDLQLLHASSQKQRDRRELASSILSEYVALLPFMYVNENSKIQVELRCSGRQGQRCAGPARVDVELSQYRMAIEITARVNHNRQRSKTLLNEKIIPDGLVQCVLRLQRITDALCDPLLANGYKFM